MIALVVTRGVGNGTFAGTIADVVTRGYAIGAAAVDAPISAARVYTLPGITATCRTAAVLTATCRTSPVLTATSRTET